MSRTVAAQEINNENFAGLLERLTQRTQKEKAGAGSSFPRRPVATVTEVKPSRGRLGSEAAELSYEKALRLHARPRSEEEIDFDLPEFAAPSPVSVPQPNSPRKSAPLKVSLQSASRASSPVQTPPAKNANANSISKRKQRHVSSKQQPQAESSAARKHVATPLKASSLPVPSQKKTASIPARKSKGPSRLDLSNDSAQERAMNAIRDAKAAALQSEPQYRRQASRSANRSKIRQSAKDSAALDEKRTAPKPQEPRQYSLQVDRQKNHPLECISDHRRSIISVRLNEEEISRLRHRASESGISVSAYMRSCVLEAEHLRAQVKQALAEMRAYSRPQESGHVSALARSVNSPTEPTGMWSRVISRSATFFLGLWIFSRQRG